jgi:hypothetical protein
VVGENQEIFSIERDTRAGQNGSGGFSDGGKRFKLDSMVGRTNTIEKDEFKIAILRRFQPGLLQNPLGPLLSLRRKGTVMEYREKFEMLIVPLRREERVMLESIFMNGLKGEIQAEMKLYECHDLVDMMDRALLIEEKNEAVMRRGTDWRDRAGTFKIKDPGEFKGSMKERSETGITFANSST